MSQYFEPLQDGYPDVYPVEIDGIPIPRGLTSLQIEEWLKTNKEKARKEAADNKSEDEKARQQRYEKQLQHIHDMIMAQSGPENILKLAEAERIVTRLYEHRFE